MNLKLVLKWKGNVNNLGKSTFPQMLARAILLYTLREQHPSMQTHAIMTSQIGV